MRLTFDPEAVAELSQAIQFFERQSMGLGERFVGEFNATVKKIIASPLLSAIVFDDFRVALCTGSLIRFTTALRTTNYYPGS